MNKHVVMVLAVIVAILTGWLVLSIAQEMQEEDSMQAETAALQRTPSMGDEVPTPSFAEIQVTVVESLSDLDSSLTAEVVAN